MRQFRAGFLVLLTLCFFSHPQFARAQATPLPGGGMIPAATQLFCPLGGAATVSSFTKTSAGNIQAVAGVAGKKVYVYGWLVYTLAASNIKLQEGTGTNCATGAADVTQIFTNGGTTTAVSSPTFLERAPIATATYGDALCVNGSAATTISGFVVTCQY